MKSNHKSGYYYAKKRIAELESELKSVRLSLDQHIEHYHWLYRHAPLWLRWWYCKTFFK